MNKFTYKWSLADLKQVLPRQVTVFSCFSGGGGSSMGYKMNGFDVIGINEVDKRMVEVYRANLNPKYIFEESIETLKTKDDLPKKMFDLDILDGSPPCSTFSVSGKREKGWGKKKKFREGQKDQILSDLFFSFIDLAKKLRPKIVVAENVKGLIIGQAKGYVKMILEGFKNIGYEVQLFLLNGAMGVPQARQRVFFVARRQDLGLQKLRLEFHEQPILWEEIKDKTIKGKRLTKKMEDIWKRRKWGDARLASIHIRETGIGGLHFNSGFLYNKKVCTTITGRNQLIRFNAPFYMSKEEVIKASSFPRDYDFAGQNFNYIMGMSVPPLMIQRVSEQIYLQWLL